MHVYVRWVRSIETVYSNIKALKTEESPLHVCIAFVFRLPGSLAGAYLEQRVGKKEAMAASTVGAALSVLAFVLVSSQLAVKIATMCISFMGESPSQ